MAGGKGKTGGASPSITEVTETTVEDDLDDIYAELEMRPPGIFTKLFIEGKIINSKSFSIFLSLNIAINAVLIGVETDLSCHSTENCDPADGFIWNVLEWWFLGVFVVEFLLKWIFLGWPVYWEDDWNKFDFSLVMLSVCDTIIMGVVLGAAGGDLKIFTVLRVLRAFRLVRIVKLLRQFKELYLLVNGMVEACKTLVWVALLLFILLYVFAIIFTISVGQSTNPALEYHGQWTKFDYWGTVPRSMFTLFQVTTGDSWGSKVAKPLMNEYPFYIVFFLLFMFLVSFGLMNVVLGVICENAMNAASQNVESMQKVVAKQQQLVINSITAIFEAADTDGSGELTKDEFDEALDKKTVKHKLRLIDVPIEDLRMLFDLLDTDGSGEITIEEFRRGCLKLQGTAKSRDMIKLSVHVSTYNRNLDDMQESMEEQNHTLERIYKRLYNLERSYFRAPAVSQDGKKKKKKKLDEVPPPKAAGHKEEKQAPVSILGAVANAGRHMAGKIQLDEQGRIMDDAEKARRKVLNDTAEQAKQAAGNAMKALTGGASSFAKRLGVQSQAKESERKVAPQAIADTATSKNAEPTNLPPGGAIPPATKAWGALKK